MGKPLPIGGVGFAATMIVVVGLAIRVSASQPVFYAHAYTGSVAAESAIKSPIFQQDGADLFGKKEIKAEAEASKIVLVEDKDLSQKMYQIVGDAPIKEMVPFIAKQDLRVAAFLVGIAKKESSFGQASPSKDGHDCYNYWGYKGSGGRGSVSGYSCFASAEEAVETVGARIQKLVDQNHTTPAKMVVWKCGSSCDWDKPEAVQSWISGVTQYFNKIIGNIG